MPRRTRLHYPGAFYQSILRGNSGRQDAANPQFGFEKRVGWVVRCAERWRACQKNHESPMVGLLLSLRGWRMIRGICRECGSEMAKELTPEGPQVFLREP